MAELVYSGSLAASSQNETISTGSVILSSSTSGAEGTVTYSINDPDSKFAINSSTGEVTLANALDHETKTSHSFTVTASDGSNSESQIFTLQIKKITDKNNSFLTRFWDSRPFQLSIYTVFHEESDFQVKNKQF